MTEGCEYRDLHDQFEALGVRIVGASFDQPAENKAFATVNNFQYTLLSDQQRELAIHFGAAADASALFAERDTVVLDPQGRWVLHYDDIGDFKQHPHDVLKDMTLILGSSGR